MPSAHGNCQLLGRTYELTSPRGEGIVRHMLNQAAALDQVFQALSDATRRAILERLSRGPASVSELAEPLPMSLPAVVQHLQVLEDSGLVRSEKLGRVRTCRVQPESLRSAQRWIDERRQSWDRRLDRLGDYLAETNPASKPRAAKTKRK